MVSDLSTRFWVNNILTDQSDTRLYTFSPETKEELRKFRLGTSRAKDPQARICTSFCSPLFFFCLILTRTDIIDPKSKEIRAHKNEVYSNLEDIADELPDSSPRFVLLSYPHTLVSEVFHVFLISH
jgi:hypothetical protein